MVRVFDTDRNGATKLRPPCQHRGKICGGSLQLAKLRLVKLGLGLDLGGHKNAFEVVRTRVNIATEFTCMLPNRHRGMEGIEKPETRQLPVAGPF